MRTKTSRSTKFNVKFFARVFFKKRYLGTAAGHFVFTHKGLSVKRRIGVVVGVFFFFLKNAVLGLGLGLVSTLGLGLGLDVEREQRVTIARKVTSNCLFCPAC